MMKGSVLFVLGKFGIGGVERVTITVANELLRRGWRVSVVAFEFLDPSLRKNLDRSIAVEELSFPAFRFSNVLRLRKFMQKQNVTSIINQWALPFPLTLMLLAARPKGAKLIAFHHNIPNLNNRIAAAGGGLRIWFWRKLSAINLSLVYRFNDVYGVLSASFKEVFSNFTGVKDAGKIWAIPNPIKVKPPLGIPKENVIIYVGRLDRFQKRVDRVIEIWKRLHKQLPEWRLEIVGDGEDREALESLARDVPRVEFFGFQDPGSFYERAQLLVLTSDFEGFGMVLVEAMSYGCVPVAFGSFAAIHDVIQEENGVIVPMPWDAERFANSVLRLAEDQDRIEKMAVEARKSVKKFSLQCVGDQYESMLTGPAESVVMKDVKP